MELLGDIDSPRDRGILHDPRRFGIATSFLRTKIKKLKGKETGYGHLNAT